MIVTRIIRTQNYICRQINTNPIIENNAQIMDYLKSDQLVQKVIVLPTPHPNPRVKQSIAPAPTVIIIFVQKRMNENVTGVSLNANK